MRLTYQFLLLGAFFLGIGIIFSQEALSTSAATNTKNKHSHMSLLHNQSPQATLTDQFTYNQCEKRVTERATDEILFPLSPTAYTKSSMPHVQESSNDVSPDQNDLQFLLFTLCRRFCETVCNQTVVDGYLAGYEECVEQRPLEEWSDDQSYIHAFGAGYYSCSKNTQKS